MSTRTTRQLLGYAAEIMGKKNVGEKFKIAVIDTITAPKNSRARMSRTRFIPGTDNKAQFIMEAGIITTESKVVIPVVEVSRTAPSTQMFLDGLPPGSDQRSTTNKTNSTVVRRRPDRIIGLVTGRAATGVKPQANNGQGVHSAVIVGWTATGTWCLQSFLYGASVTIRIAACTTCSTAEIFDAVSFSNGS